MPTRNDRVEMEAPVSMAVETGANKKGVVNPHILNDGGPVAQEAARQ